MLVAHHFTNPVTSPLSTVSAATAVPFQFFVPNTTAHHLRLWDLRHRHFRELHTTPLQKQRLHAVLRPMAHVSPRRVRSLHFCLRPPYSPISAPPRWNHIPVSSPKPPKRGAGAALPRTHLVISAEARVGRGPFPKPMPAIILMVRFGPPKPSGHGNLHNADSDFMHHQYRLSVLQWNPGTPPTSSQRLVDGFMRSSYKKPVIMCHMSRTNSWRTQVIRTSPSCSTGTHSSPTLQSLLFKQLRQARTRGVWWSLWSVDGQETRCLH